MRFKKPSNFFFFLKQLLLNLQLSLLNSWYVVLFPKRVIYINPYFQNNFHQYHVHTWILCQSSFKWPKSCWKMIITLIITLIISTLFCTKKIKFRNLGSFMTCQIFSSTTLVWSVFMLKPLLKLENWSNIDVLNHEFSRLFSGCHFALFVVPCTRDSEEVPFNGRVFQILYFPRSSYAFYCRKGILSTEPLLLFHATTGFSVFRFLLTDSQRRI